MLTCLLKIQCQYYAGVTCSSGSCDVCIDPSQVFCSGNCFDISSDPSNCGPCGNRVSFDPTIVLAAIRYVCSPTHLLNQCPNGSICSSGSCICTSCGQPPVNGVCPNFQTDPQNCGACGNVVGTMGGSLCITRGRNAHME
jgi:hypothetical protein